MACWSICIRKYLTESLHPLETPNIPDIEFTLAVSVGMLVAADEVKASVTFTAVPITISIIV